MRGQAPHFRLTANEPQGSLLFTARSRILGLTPWYFLSSRLTSKRTRFLLQSSGIYAPTSLLGYLGGAFLLDYCEAIHKNKLALSRSANSQFSLTPLKARFLPKQLMASALLVDVTYCLGT